MKPGTKPYLVARVALNRSVLLEAAASAAGCLECGSGGPLVALFAAASAPQNVVARAGFGMRKVLSARLASHRVSCCPGARSLPNGLDDRPPERPSAGVQE
jgi:hypothetical protein